MRRSKVKGDASFLIEAKAKLAELAQTVVVAVEGSESVTADVAEDAVQTAIRDLLRQWKTGGVPSDIRSFKAYLWRCAVNVIREWARKRKDARLRNLGGYGRAAQVCCSLETPCSRIGRTTVAPRGHPVGYVNRIQHKVIKRAG